LTSEMKLASILQNYQATDVVNYRTLTSSSATCERQRELTTELKPYRASSATTLPTPWFITNH